MAFELVCDRFVLVSSIANTHTLNKYIELNGWNEQVCYTEFHILIKSSNFLSSSLRLYYNSDVFQHLKWLLNGIFMFKVHNDNCDFLLSFTYIITILFWGASRSCKWKIGSFFCQVQITGSFCSLRRKYLKFQ